MLRCGSRGWSRRTGNGGWGTGMALKQREHTGALPCWWWCGCRLPPGLQESKSLSMEVQASRPPCRVPSTSPPPNAHCPMPSGLWKSGAGHKVKNRISARGPNDVTAHDTSGHGGDFFGALHFRIFLRGIEWTSPKEKQFHEKFGFLPGFFILEPPSCRFRRLPPRCPDEEARAQGKRGRRTNKWAGAGGAGIEIWEQSTPVEAWQLAAEP